MVNLDMIASEIVRAFSGSLGMVIGGTVNRVYRQLALRALLAAGRRNPRRWEEGQAKVERKSRPRLRGLREKEE